MPTLEGYDFGVIVEGQLKMLGNVKP
jgi:hypothetical protein